LTAIAVLAGALALSMSLAVLVIGRIDSALRFCALQALAAAVAAEAQGWVWNASSLHLAGMLALAMNGVALPLAFHRFIKRTSEPLSFGHRHGLIASLAASVALITTSVAAAIAVARGERFELLALGLSVLLLGQLLLALRTHRLLPALGLLSSQNGVVLAVCAIPGLPPSTLLLATVPLIPSLVLASICLCGLNRPVVGPPWT
jgi:hydrogenase-4 membrane subunit HyfE